MLSNNENQESSSRVLILFRNVSQNGILFIMFRHYLFMHRLGRFIKLTLCGLKIMQSQIVLFLQTCKKFSKIFAQVLTTKRIQTPSLFRFSSLDKAHRFLLTFRSHSNNFLIVVYSTVRFSSKLIQSSGIECIESNNEFKGKLLHSKVQFPSKAKKELNCKIWGFLKIFRIFAIFH